MTDNVDVESKWASRGLVSFCLKETYHSNLSTSTSLNDSMASMI